MVLHFEISIKHIKPFSFQTIEFGLLKPAILQEQAIPIFLKGKDLIVRYQAGAGKTVSYAISVLQMIEEQQCETQALILNPTREIAIRTAELLKSVAKYLKISIATCVGGTKIAEDIATIKGKPQVVLGTPGRVFDMIMKGYFSISNLKMVILDETDDLVSKGFLEQLRDIFKQIPKGVQVKTKPRTN